VPEQKRPRRLLHGVVDFELLPVEASLEHACEASGYYVLFVGLLEQLNELTLGELDLLKDTVDMLIDTVVSQRRQASMSIPGFD
jgi:hypothetical protein